MAIKISELPRITNGTVSDGVIFPAVANGVTYSASFGNVVLHVSNTLTTFSKTITANISSQKATISNAIITVSDTTTASIQNLSVTTSGSINSLTATTVGITGTLTASSGSINSLTVSTTVAGMGFATYLASPPDIGGTTPSAGKFTTVAITSPVAPISATSAGSTGTVAWDSNYIYVCVAPNTWRRSSLSSW